MQADLDLDLGLDSGAILGGAFQTIVYSPNDHPIVYVVQTSFKRPKQTFDPTYYGAAEGGNAFSFPSLLHLPFTIYLAAMAVA